MCDHAGFAPFGFGYRRCPGEQLTIQVFEDFLRKVWENGIEFQKLDISSPEPSWAAGGKVGPFSSSVSNRGIEQ